MSWLGVEIADGVWCFLWCNLAYLQGTYKVLFQTQEGPKPKEQFLSLQADAAFSHHLQPRSLSRVLKGLTILTGCLLGFLAQALSLSLSAVPRSHANACPKDTQQNPSTPAKTTWWVHIFHNPFFLSCGACDSLHSYVNWRVCSHPVSKRLM